MHHRWISVVLEYSILDSKNSKQKTAEEMWIIQILDSRRCQTLQPPFTWDYIHKVTLIALTV